MKGIARIISSCTCVLSALAVAVLIFSLGLHSLQVAHDHPEHTTAVFASSESGSEKHDHAGVLVSLGEYVHMGEKKWFLLMLLPVLLFEAVRRILFGTWRMLLSSLATEYRVFIAYQKLRPLTFYDHLTHNFMRGILHPKIF